MKLLNSFTLVPIQKTQAAPAMSRVTLDLGPYDQHNTCIRIDTDMGTGSLRVGQVIQVACRQAIAALETIAKANSMTS